MIPTTWQGIHVFAREAGEVHPYDPSNARLFRGEEAFSATIAEWERWSKPSPEPYLDNTFHTLVLREITQHAELVAGMVRYVANALRETTDAPPLLIALLRAGVPVATLLAQRLARAFGAEVPIVALSLFHGLGWDTAALVAALKSFPGRPVWFVDGWTGRGGVAQELHDSYRRWLADGYTDFTAGEEPCLAVLCDPGGFASVSATCDDVLIPSACFTAPEVLGFSRGFVKNNTEMFSVYRYPATLMQPAYHTAWLSIGMQQHSLSSTPSACLAHCNTHAIQARIRQAPPSYRLFTNEVVRALLNRNPLEILFRDNEATVAETLAPIVYLSHMRDIPVQYGQTELDTWGCLAAAQMQQ